MAAAADVVRRPPKVAPASIITLIVLCKLSMVAFSIAQISIGAKYLKQCTQQNYIPVYVLVCGMFGISLSLPISLPCFENDKPGVKYLCIIWRNLASVFLGCWSIAGMVWIYSIYPPKYNSTVVGDQYCNKTLYLFAFWTTILGNILIPILLVCYCCFYVCVNKCKPKGQSEDVPQT